MLHLSQTLINNTANMQLTYAVFALVGYIAFWFVARLIVDFIRRGKFMKKHGCKPISKIVYTWEPFLGLDYMYKCVQNAKRGYYMRFQRSRFQEYGTTFAIRRSLFDTLHTVDPENIKFILATGFENYKLATLRVKAMMPLFGTGIFTTDGPAWAHSRAILRPSFTRQNMAPLLRMMERHWQMLLRQVPADGVTFDVQNLFFCFAMDTATEFLMGHSTHTLDTSQHHEAEKTFVEDYLNCCYEVIRQIAMGPLQGLSTTPKGIPEARDRAWAYVDSFVDQALAKREKRATTSSSSISLELEPEEEDGDSAEYNFLATLSSQTTDRKLLREQVLGVLLASRDTTAALISNMFYELSRNPEIYSRLRRECLSQINSTLPTEGELNSMTYLRWCLNEALRLHPVVPGNTREAACDTVLPRGGGKDGKEPIFVKKGTPVLYNVYTMHRRKDLYGEDADVCRPERWEGLRPGWGFLPFNGGPRICLGREFFPLSLPSLHHFQSLIR